MKKLSLYVFLLLMFCNVGFAECIKGDCINGYGTYTYGSGTKYVGEYKDDKRHGQGTFTTSSGSKYVGGWKDGKTHGQGTFTYADGNKYVGGWKDGKYHGQGTYTYADGTFDKGIWKDGKLAEKAKKKKTSSLFSKEAIVIKTLMENENWTEKQAKCLIKKTKPLIKKEDWNKYVKLLQSKKQNLSDDDIGIVFEIGFAMMAQYSKCGVTN